MDLVQGREPCALWGERRGWGPTQSASRVAPCRCPAAFLTESLVVFFALGGCGELERKAGIMASRNEAALVSGLSSWPTY